MIARFPHDDVRPDYEGDTKAARVERMFDAIAPTYDRLNALLSFGTDRRWRRHLVDRVLAGSPRRALDVATGTGDLAIALARRGLDVTGVDLSQRMLDAARAKAARASVGVHFERADAEGLPFDADAFDLVTVAFGVRNFEHLERGMCELVRVLRPGGALAVLELSEPTAPVVRTVHALHARFVLPRVGRAVSGEAAAYTYLPASVAAFPSGARFVAVLERCGARVLETRALTFGAATLYVATK